MSHHLKILQTPESWPLWQLMPVLAVKLTQQPGSIESPIGPILRCLCLVRELQLDELLILRHFECYLIGRGRCAGKVSRLEAIKVKVQVDCFGLARG